MAFSESTEYPSGIFQDLTLDAVAAGVGVSGDKIKVSHMILRGGAMADAIIFRRSGAGAEYFRIKLGAASLLVVETGFEAPGGLEVITDGVGGSDTEVTIFYFQGD